MKKFSQNNQMNPNNLDNDTLALDDTLCNEQVLLSDDQQATQLKHSRLAHFKIIDILGKGGMGAVYKAKDLALERFVAIKMIHISKDQRPLILAEAKTISKLNHPNIVTVYDIARDEDANFIVMEWVDGQPLNAVIPSQGLPLKKVLAYTQQIVAALSCAHQQLIIHRDIKPQNIMVDVNGHIKVLDFGIAALIEPLEQEPSAPEPSAEKKQEPSADHKQPIITGSPLYMAPEQILGQASDARSDLFSLGIVLYEMLTGVKPFLGFNFQQISQAITKGEYTSLAELIVEQKAEHKTESKTAVPAELIAIVDKLLQVEPSARYQSAAELAQELNVIDEKINHKKNWWQQQHWLMKIVIAMPLMVILAWSIRSVLFPPSTQELIARQLLESKKIAFLPFDNISGDPVLQIFSDGIATMLSSDLAEVGYQQGDGTTWVLPISDIRNLEDSSITGIYNKYGVDTIITGSIQHMGSTRSLHLSLIN
ncbi:MAG: protein kinase, partial [Colwellia sp.]|nr:protein kinase [Colwellia sp.]